MYIYVFTHEDYIFTNKMLFNYAANLGGFEFGFGFEFFASGFGLSLVLIATFDMSRYYLIGYFTHMISNYEH